MKSRFNSVTRVLAAFGAFAAISQPAFAADLDLNIGPLAQAQGNLMVAVYNSAATFRKEAVQQQQLAASAGVMQVRFTNLAPGDYAVAIFHDANGNGKLDSNMLGIPKEPYGFSKLEKSLMGPPGWDDVKFVLPAEGSRLEIKLR